MDALYCVMKIMTRSYTLKQRAESQADTRRRIVEATVELHSTLGPARTSISAVAERAGVQRHTVYAHFPTEKDLFAACSGMAMERDPLPDETAWQAISDPEQRLQRGLSELYAWYARNAEMTASVLRDAEVHAMTRETARRTMAPRMHALQQALVQGFGKTRDLRAAVGLAMSFHTWRSLVQDNGMNAQAAVDLMVRAVRCVAEKR